MSREPFIHLKSKMRLILHHVPATKDYHLILMYHLSIQISYQTFYLLIFFLIRNRKNDVNSDRYRPKIKEKIHDMKAWRLLKI